MFFSLRSNRCSGRQATLLPPREALRDNQSNGCEGDYIVSVCIIIYFISFQDILYIGDHIFGDILKSKKKQGWR